MVHLHPEPAVPAWVSLGANLGEPVAAFRAALSALDRWPGNRVVAVSSLYRTAPVDAQGPDFLNAVACVHTALGPLAFLEALQALEQQAGRERPYWHAPRTLDLDLLLHGQTVMASERLILPHPRLHERAFVLMPLREVAPALVVPGLGLPLSDWMRRAAGATEGAGASGGVLGAGWTAQPIERLRTAPDGLDWPPASLDLDAPS